MRHSHAAIAALVLAALAAPLAAKKPAAQPVLTCTKVLAEIETVWVDDGSVEVGTVNGLLNGAVYLRYSENDDPIDPATSKPNMVISSKEGQLQLWVVSKSQPLEGDSWTRLFTVVQAAGTDGFAQVMLDLSTTGTFTVGKGGKYTMIGAICVPTQGIRR